MTSDPSASGEKAGNRTFRDRYGEINSEADYNRVSSHLADELTRENTAEELALALAHHLIYVDELRSVIREQRRLIQAQEAATTRREGLIVEMSIQAATEVANKTATKAAIAIRRNLSKVLASNEARLKRKGSRQSGHARVLGRLAGQS
jgi:glutamate racemase